MLPRRAVRGEDELLQAEDEEDGRTQIEELSHEFALASS